MLLHVNSAESIMSKVYEGDTIEKQGRNGYLLHCEAYDTVYEKVLNFSIKGFWILWPRETLQIRCDRVIMFIETYPVFMPNQINLLKIWLCEIYPFSLIQGLITLSLLRLRTAWIKGCLLLVSGTSQLFNYRFHVCLEALAHATIPN